MTRVPASDLIAVEDIARARDMAAHSTACPLPGER